MEGEGGSERERGRERFVRGFVSALLHVRADGGGGGLWGQLSGGKREWHSSIFIGDCRRDGRDVCFVSAVKRVILHGQSRRNIGCGGDLDDFYEHNYGEQYSV